MQKLKVYFRLIVIEISNNPIETEKRTPNKIVPEVKAAAIGSANTPETKVEISGKKEAVQMPNSTIGQGLNPVAISERDSGIREQTPAKVVPEDRPNSKAAAEVNDNTTIQNRSPRKPPRSQRKKTRDSPRHEATEAKKPVLESAAEVTVVPVKPASPPREQLKSRPPTNPSPLSRESKTPQSNLAGDPTPVNAVSQIEKVQEKPVEMSARKVVEAKVVQVTETHVQAKANVMRKRAVDEEEELIAQGYAKLLLQQEEAAEKGKLEGRNKMLDEMPPPTAMSASSFGSEEDINTMFVADNSNQAADKIKRQLFDQKMIAMLTQKLGKNDDIKNIILQRTEAEFAAFQKCDNLLTNFFTSEKFPAFMHPNLAQAKFTPYVDFHAKDEEESEPSQAKGANSPGTRKSQPDPSVGLQFVEGTGTGSETERIFARNIEDVYSKKDSQFAALCAQSDMKFEDMIKQLDGQPLLPGQMFGWLRSKLSVFDKLMAERRQQLAQLGPSQKESRGEVHMKGESRSSISENAKKPMISGLRSSVKNVGRRQSDMSVPTKRYRVNFDILNRRGQMDQIEIMERRYHLLSDRDVVNNNRILSPRSFASSAMVRPADKY